MAFQVYSLFLQVQEVLSHDTELLLVHQLHCVIHTSKDACAVLSSPALLTQVAGYVVASAPFPSRFTHQHVA